MARNISYPTRLISAHGTAEEWTLANPILNNGEIGVATDIHRLKIGDGVTRWNDLSWIVSDINATVSLGDEYLIGINNGGTGVKTFEPGFLKSPYPGGHSPLITVANIIEDDFLFSVEKNNIANATSTVHGLLPKLSDDNTEFLSGKGTWLVPKYMYPTGLSLTPYSNRITVGVKYKSNEAGASELTTSTENIPAATTDTAGLITSDAQTIGGVKTFTDGIVSNVVGNVVGNVIGNADTSTTINTAMQTPTSSDPLNIDTLIEPGEYCIKNISINNNAITGTLPSGMGSSDGLVLRVFDPKNSNGTSWGIRVIQFAIGTVSGKVFVRTLTRANTSSSYTVNTWKELGYQSDITDILSNDISISGIKTFTDGIISNVTGNVTGNSDTATSLKYTEINNSDSDSTKRNLNNYLDSGLYYCSYSTVDTDGTGSSGFLQSSLPPKPTSYGTGFYLQVFNKDKSIKNWVFGYQILKWVAYNGNTTAWVAFDNSYTYIRNFIIMSGNISFTPWKKILDSDDNATSATSLKYTEINNSDSDYRKRNLNNYLDSGIYYSSQCTVDTDGTGESGILESSLPPRPTSEKTLGVGFYLQVFNKDKTISNFGFGYQILKWVAYNGYFTAWNVYDNSYTYIRNFITSASSGGTVSFTPWKKILDSSDFDPLSSNVSNILDGSTTFDGIKTFSSDIVGNIDTATSLKYTAIDNSDSDLSKRNLNNYKNSGLYYCASSTVDTDGTGESGILESSLPPRPTTNNSTGVRFYLQVFNKDKTSASSFVGYQLFTWCYSSKLITYYRGFNKSTVYPWIKVMDSDDYDTLDTSISNILTGTTTFAGSKTFTSTITGNLSGDVTGNADTSYYLKPQNITSGNDSTTDLNDYLTPGLYYITGATSSDPLNSPIPSDLSNAASGDAPAQNYIRLYLEVFRNNPSSSSSIIGFQRATYHWYTSSNTSSVKTYIRGFCRSNNSGNFTFTSWKLMLDEKDISSLNSSVSNILNGSTTFSGTKTFSSTINGNLSGNVTGNLTGNVTGNITGNVTGNADTATEFSSNKSVELTGDVTGSASSKAGWSVSTTLSNSGVSAGSYGPSSNSSPSHGSTFSVPYITVDAKGRVTSASTKSITLPSDNNTDTLVTQNKSTTNNTYPILMTPTANASSDQGAKTSIFATGVKVNPSTNVISASGGFSGNLTGNITGNLTGTASNATNDENGRNISTGYLWKGSYERIEGTSSNHKDLNSYIDPGFYNVKPKYVDNCPDGIGIDAVLLVYPWASNNANGTSNGNYILQEITEAGASTKNRRWLRKNNASSGFSDWIQVAFTNSDITGNAATATEFSSNKSVALTGDVTGSASSKAGWSISTTLSNSGVTAGNYGPSANASPSHGSTFSVPYITVDSKGRVTSASTKTITLPSDDNTDTLVTQSKSTTNSTYPVLLTPTANASSDQGAKTSIFATGVKVNPSTNVISASGGFSGDLTGNAGSAYRLYYQDINLNDDLNNYYIPGLYIAYGATSTSPSNSPVPSDLDSTNYIRLYLEVFNSVPSPVSNSSFVGFQRATYHWYTSVTTNAVRTYIRGFYKSSIDSLSSLSFTPWRLVLDERDISSLTSSVSNILDGTTTFAGSKTFSSTITGNLTGNVTGNLTGTADKAISDENGNNIYTKYLMRRAYEKIAGTSSEHKDLNNYNVPGFYSVTTTYVDNVPTGIGTYGLLIVYPYTTSTTAETYNGNYPIQEITECSGSTTNKRWIRSCNAGTFSTWKRILNDSDYTTLDTNISTTSTNLSTLSTNLSNRGVYPGAKLLNGDFDFDNITDHGDYYINNYSGTISHYPGTKSYGWLQVKRGNGSSNILQIFKTYSSSSSLDFTVGSKLYIRNRSGTTWYAWKEIALRDVGIAYESGSSTSKDLNNYVESGVYGFGNSVAGNSSSANFPSSSNGLLLVWSNTGHSVVTQLYIVYQGAAMYIRGGASGGTWSEWKPLGYGYTLESVDVSDSSSDIKVPNSGSKWEYCIYEFDSSTNAFSNFYCGTINKNTTIVTASTSKIYKGWYRRVS